MMPAVYTCIVMVFFWYFIVMVFFGDYCAIHLAIVQLTELWCTIWGGGGGGTNRWSMRVPLFMCCTTPYYVVALFPSV